MNIFDYGYIPGQQPEEGTIARVTAVHKERYALFCDYGEVYGRLKAKPYYDGNEEFPTAGDFVRIDYQPDGDSRITATLPRKTYFSRRDPLPGKGEQAVAANFNTVFVMQSLNHDFNIKRLERYLTLAWQSGATPVVVLTKADLISDPTAQLALVQKVAAGVDIIAVSAATRAGLEQLAEFFQPGKTVVFLGSSGVGKSSLVNALAGEELMQVNDIREDDSRGRHTTTHRQLLRLRNGAMIIDTPGMRELGMWDVSSGLGEAFADVTRYLGSCRFNDCTHRTEPGCAIRAALESGELTGARWKSYCALHAEAEYTDDSASYLRKKTQLFKDIAKKNRQTGNR